MDEVTDGALLECGKSVEEAEFASCARGCESQDGDDKGRNLCAAHAIAFPRGETSIL
jgi:hypothetical protein